MQIAAPCSALLKANEVLAWCPGAMVTIQSLTVVQLRGREALAFGAIGIVIVRHVIVLVYVCMFLFPCGFGGYVFSLPMGSVTKGSG